MKFSGMNKFARISSRAISVVRHRLATDAGFSTSGKIISGSQLSPVKSEPAAVNSPQRFQV